MRLASPPIGLGRIAQEMVLRAKAFDMNVVAWSRSLTPDRAELLGVGCKKSPLDVASAADIVSVHLALAPETCGQIGAEFFNAMKDE
jgi:D-3-phosphoglycerate dehydrogenase